MDWLTVLWLAIIVGMIIFVVVIDKYFRKRKNNRRFELGNDLPVGNFTDRLSSESSPKPQFGGGSGGGGGATRNFTPSATEAASVTDGRIIAAHSIVNGEFAGDLVSGNLLSSTDTVASIVEENATIDAAANLLSTTVDSEGVVSAAVEFMSGATGNAIEVAGEVVGSAAEVAGEIIAEIISSN